MVNEGEIMKKVLGILISLLVMASLVQIRVAEAALEDITIGGDIRIRGVYTENITDLNDDTRNNNDIDEAQFFRHRTRVFVKGEAEGGFTGYVRAVAEPRWGTGNDISNGYGWTEHILFDNSYIEAKDFFGTPLTLKIGRQDLIYGEGFLILDGTPNDGSRTIYFDAIKVTGALGDTSIDVFTAKIDEGPDGGTKTEMNDQDLYGIYVTNKSIPNHKIEAYCFHKEKRDRNADTYEIALLESKYEDEGVELGTDPNSKYYPIQKHEQEDGTYTYKNYMLLPKRRTTVIGARFTGNIIDNISYGIELAKQFGKISYEADYLYDPSDPNSTVSVDVTLDQEAFGGYAHLTYAIPTAIKPRLKAGVYYTSGDDQESDKYEAWDGFFSDWPKYSELATYTNYDGLSSRTVDPEEGTWSNFTIYELQASIKPIEKMMVTATYLYLLANEENGNGNGTERGHLPKVKVAYQFSDKVSGHLLGEYFKPGAYYPNDSNDDAIFARFQMMYKF